MEKIIVTLRGGTRLRMDAERKPEAPFDRLLALLDSCESWHDGTREWAGGTMRGAQVVDVEDSQPQKPFVDLGTNPDPNNELRVKCRSLGHPIHSTKLPGRCYFELKCPICRIKWREDSSD